LRPSLIHGPEGEFIQMMKFFSTSKVRQPVMPYFGRGTALIQPVSVRDVATVFVKALGQPETVGQVHELGGPERFTWKELYDVCARAFTGRTRIKVPVPVLAAKLAAITVMPQLPRLLVPYRFNVAQVQMSQEDSICNHAVIETAFHIKLRDFREELGQYADLV
jgi:NADH dehydrogenase